mmetsp:Transcript_10372/g.24977  ORF Transcript_10372/g.24977 Transcript_10372/m.24977 type:complete len:202 (+) Transcript_10372:215-820(+)
MESHPPRPTPHLGAQLLSDGDMSRFLWLLWREDGVVHDGTVPFQRAQALCCVGIPYPCGPVGGSCDNLGSVHRKLCRNDTIAMSRKCSNAFLLGTVKIPELGRSIPRCRQQRDTIARQHCRGYVSPMALQAEQQLLCGYVPEFGRAILQCRKGQIALLSAEDGHHHFTSRPLQGLYAISRVEIPHLSAAIHRSRQNILAIS